MKLDLETKLEQKLTPQLIQSLKLLQVPTLRLEQILRQELAINPLLEEVEEEGEAEENQLEEEKEKELELSEDVDWDRYLEEGFDIGYEFRSTSQETEDMPDRTPAYESNLNEHLQQQLHFKQLTDEEYYIGEFIIGNIDEEGYLTCSLEEIAEILQQPLEKCQKVLSLIQSFDPPGVGARSLRESLLIQIKEKGMEDDLVRKIIAEHLDELDRRSHTQLAKALNVQVEDIQLAMEKIARLSPKPALGNFAIPAKTIIPDMTIRKVGDDYEVILNDSHIPHLQISRRYREFLKKSSQVSEEARSYIKEKLNSARWLINSIEQRRSTMLNVTRAIVEKQRDFLDHGISALKPLTMEEVAERVGVHLSTVSRVVNDKYAQTPQGICELRSFFGGKVGGTRGEELSTQSVLQLIREMVEDEDASHPLSDRTIAVKLAEQGIDIARRTVAKYREQLKILPARFRKRVKKKGPTSSGTKKN